MGNGWGMVGSVGKCEERWGMGGEWLGMSGECVGNGGK